MARARLLDAAALYDAIEPFAKTQEWLKYGEHPGRDTFDSTCQATILLHAKMLKSLEDVAPNFAVGPDVAKQAMLKIAKQNGTIWN